ncbi:MAG TPA: MFS transporter [Caulobacteraceae bacterium]|nr:MFS transporter [Caulobacteraceae bacterium]
MTAHTLCDRGIALTRQGRAPDHPRLVLATTILASSLAFIDGSVVNVGLPAIGHSLKGSAASLSWVINAYLLPLSALILFGGALGDRFGRRRLLNIGVALFAGSSIACAVAPSLVWLCLARALQGIGAALLLPNSLAILGDSFEGEARGRAIGVWSATGAMMSAAGPVLGGWLIDKVGWPAIFLINPPLAAAAFVLALASVRDDSGDARGAPLDVAGATLATAALAAITWALTTGSGAGGWTPAVLAVAAAGVILGGVFVWTEKRLGDHAMTPLALFASRQMAALNLMTFLLYGALAGYLLLLPYVLIEALHYSALAAGAALLPFPIVMSLVSPVAGAIAGRIGPRIPLIAGCLLVAAGLLAGLLIDPGGGYWTGVAPGVLALGLGMAWAAAPLTTAVLSSVDARHTGAASGLNSAVSRIGGVVVVASIGAVLASHGAALVHAFRLAAVAGSVIAAAAAACSAVVQGGPAKRRAG